MFELQSPWLNGYGAIREAPAQEVKHIKDLPATREGQRLIRVQDWVHDGPYWLVAQSNGRILQMGISELRAMDYLLQIGFHQAHVDGMTYQAVLWGNRHGAVRPLCPLREDDQIPVWDVLTAQEVV